MSMLPLNLSQYENHHLGWLCTKSHVNFGDSFLPAFYRNEFSLHRCREMFSRMKKFFKDDQSQNLSMGNNT